MPIFICYRGDCADLALQETGPSAFTAPDALGRECWCVNTGPKEMSSEGLPDSVLKLMQAQALAHRQGASCEGSTVMLFDCPDETTLRRRLVLGTYPQVEESAQRLAQAGWMLQQYTWGTDSPWRLTLTDGREAFTVSGENENEAWYRAVVEELGPLGVQEKRTMSTTLAVQDIPVPLRTIDGELRVGDTRVPLDVVIREFKAGAEPDAIARAYPTLQRADVYAVIAYYLRNQDEVDAYLRGRREEARKLRQEIEAQQPDRNEFRAKLLARRAQKEQGHAASGD